MTRQEHVSKIDELEALLNDPDVALLPDRVWALLAEVAGNPAYAGEANESASGFTQGQCLRLREQIDHPQVMPFGRRVQGLAITNRIARDQLGAPMKELIK